MLRSMSDNLLQVEAKVRDTLCFVVPGYVKVKVRYSLAG